MSLKRIETEDKNLSELQQEMTNLAYMKAAREQDARQDKEVAILLSTVQKMCVIQEDFMQNMLQKFDELNKSQMNLLNVQKYYEKSVKDSTVKVVHDIYYEFATEQKKAFNDIRKYLANDTEQMIKKINNAAKGAERSANMAKETADRIYRLEGWKAFLFYLSPAAVILNIIIRLLIAYGG